jgi:hypothetical protein
MSWYPSRKGGRTWNWGPLWWNRNYIDWWMEPERAVPPSVHHEPKSGVLLGPTEWRPRQHPEIGGWKKQPRWSKAWIQETEEPWRCGIGYALKLGNHTYNLGIWRRRDSPVEQYNQLISNLATTPLEGE